MKENKLSSAFKGFIELDQVKGELEGFVNYVKSDLNDELKMVRPAMLVVAQSEEQALLFAQGAISILREEHLSSYYVIRPSFLWNRPISDEYDCVLVNDFDDKLTELNELERIIEEMIEKGVMDDLEDDDAEEVLRIIRPKTEEDREKEGILLIKTLNERGREVCYLDGGRGIRLKISRAEK